MGKEILIVDDEENIVELVKYNLEEEGYSVLAAYDGKEALNKAREEKPDLMVLDLMLPEVDGFDVCRRLRSDEDLKELPIIILSAKEEEMDKVLGLELGADDYLTKPFSPRELKARIKAVLRRSDFRSESLADREEIIEIGELKLDPGRHEVKIKGEELQLTPKEFDVLSFLMLNAGQVFSRESLLERIWGYEYQGATRTVDVHIRRLRKKIEGYSQQEYIKTVRGVGYKFMESIK